jgi:beta-glucosidase-like glycosyl hydrolase
VQPISMVRTINCFSRHFTKANIHNLGCQSEGIGATAKHFVANDVEKRRRFLTAEIDERTLREIYLYPFQLILKLSHPWCFMTRYSSITY